MRESVQPAASIRRAPVLALGLLLLAGSVCAACVFAPEAGKGARPDESVFQHETPSPGGFFRLHWNSEGDSAFAAERVAPLLAALDSSLAAQESWGAPWPIPLGARPAYPVFVAPLNAIGATSAPYSEGGVQGLTWMLLDNRPERWSDEPIELLEVAAAHELFHARQFARVFSWDELAFYEASAVWAEDRVYPDHDDWARRYLPAWLATWTEPLDETDGLREYGAGCAVKFLLADGDDLGPLWTAIDAPALDFRCWYRLLHGLPEGGGSGLLALAAERLRAGRPGPFRVPELSGAAPFDLAELPAPAAPATLSPPPEELAAVAGLSIGAVRLAAGRLRLAWADDLAVAARLEGLDGEPEPLGAADTLLSAGPSTLLLKACEFGGPRSLLDAWQALGAAPALLVWPNPGGRLRTIEFAGAPQPLALYDLLGQRLWTWTPPSTASRQILDLPGRWRGPLFLATEDGTIAAPLTHWPD